jgi:hypothetical protein
MEGTIPPYATDHAETDSEGQTRRAEQDGTSTACTVDGSLLSASQATVRHTKGGTNPALAVVVLCALRWLLAWSPIRSTSTADLPAPTRDQPVVPEVRPPSDRDILVVAELDRLAWSLPDARDEAELSSAQQCQLLLFLHRVERHTQPELAEAFAVSRPTGCSTIQRTTLRRGRHVLPAIKQASVGISHQGPVHQRCGPDGQGPAPPRRRRTRAGENFNNPEDEARS